MRKNIFMVITVAAALAVFTGCGADSDGDPAPKENISSCASSEATDSNETAHAADNVQTDNSADETNAADAANRSGTDAAGSGDQNSAADELDPLPDFDTVDLNGNQVTGEIFRGKDVTMVNFWGTYCSPCIDEMPELEKLSQSLPENAQIVGVVTDALANNSGVTQEAQRIVNMTGVTYPNILLDNALYTYAIQNIQFMPTTIFLDGGGNIIGSEIIGSDVDAYAEQLEQLLDGWTYEEKS